MKPKFSLCFLLLYTSLSSYVHAQSFGVEGSYWRFCAFHVWPSQGYISCDLSLSGPDTSYGIPLLSLDGSLFQQLNTDSVLLHVQGDSTFVYDPVDSSMTLLFDFSMQNGDVFTVNEHNSIYVTHTSLPHPYDIYYTVIESGTELQQGTQLHYYILRPDSSSVPEWQLNIGNFRRWKVVERMGAFVEHFGSYYSSAVLPYVAGSLWEGISSPRLYYYENSASPEFYTDSVDCVLSQENVLLPVLRLFPNPAADYISLYADAEFIPKKLWISDLSGRIIRYEVPAPAALYQLQLKGLQSGVYLLGVMDTDGRNYSIRFVKY